MTDGSPIVLEEQEAVRLISHLPGAVPAATGLA
jgi:hypothetical protein